MSVASIFNIPSTPEEMEQWSFANAAHHRDIIDRIYELNGVELVEYILDPFDANNVGVWAYQHQEMHNAQNAVLGIAGFDLTEVDFKNKEILAGWIFNHAYEHKQAADILELD